MVRVGSPAFGGAAADAVRRYKQARPKRLRLLFSVSGRWIATADYRGGKLFTVAFDDPDAAMTAGSLGLWSWSSDTRWQDDDRVPQVRMGY